MLLICYRFIWFSFFFHLYFLLFISFIFLFVETQFKWMSDTMIFFKLILMRVTYLWLCITILLLSSSKKGIRSYKKYVGSIGVTTVNYCVPSSLMKCNCKIKRFYETTWKSTNSCKYNLNENFIKKTMIGTLTDFLDKQRLLCN